jgi:putative peptidoglycan lipid II flippase
MVGYAMQNILSRAYFAKQEGKGPLIAGGLSIIVNLLLCMVLVDTMGVAGLAIASAASSTVYALLLDLPLERKGEGFLSGTFVVELGKMLLAAVIMAVAAGAVLALTAEIFHGKLGLLVSMAASAGTGVAVYFIAALVLGLREAVLVREMIKRVLKRG